VTPMRVASIVMLSGLMSSACVAQELVAGWEGEASQGYTFVTPMFTVAGSDRQALLVRPSVSFLYYDIGTGESEQNVRSPGAAIGLGYRVSGPRASFAVTPGIEIRRTTRIRQAGTSDVIERGATIQSELFVHPTGATQISALGSYGRANRYTWLRGGVMQQVKQNATVGIGIGVEGTVQGNADFQTIQAGLATEWTVRRAALSIQARAGYARHSEGNAGPVDRAYFGIGFYRRF